MKVSRLLCAVLLAACAGHGPRRFVPVPNGGVTLVHAPCDVVTVVRGPDRLVVTSADDPSCAAGDLVPVGAAAVYWRIHGASWAGPRSSNQVILKLPELDAGEDRRGLASGEDRAGLASDEGRRGLANGEEAQRLDQGEDAQELAASDDGRSLSSGEEARELASGDDAQQLSSGDSARGLQTVEEARAVDAGEASRSTVELTKSISTDWLEPGAIVVVSLGVRNVGVAPISEVVVIDRLDPRLRVAQLEGDPRALPDGSTLVVWRSAGAIAPGGVATFEVGVTAR